MTENDLKIELECYRLYINPDCDTDNLTEKDTDEFYNYYLESEEYYNGLERIVAVVSGIKYSNIRI